MCHSFGKTMWFCFLDRYFKFSLARQENFEGGIPCEMPAFWSTHLSMIECVGERCVYSNRSTPLCGTLMVNGHRQAQANRVTTLRDFLTCLRRSHLVLHFSGPGISRRINKGSPKPSWPLTVSSSLTILWGLLVLRPPGRNKYGLLLVSPGFFIWWTTGSPWFLNGNGWNYQDGTKLKWARLQVFSW